MKRPSLDELTLKEKISQLLMVHEGRMHQCGVDAFLEAVEKYQYGSMWISGGAKMAVCSRMLPKRVTHTLLVEQIVKSLHTTLVNT